ncbi:hypothetical protein BKA65DRAFT_548123 [Rhexocercosporidium sp. MPI-PUGE-AT-0058]|nr:hypothetical protein BKA65DRAFT_548123 [Rhexocercosporidium sp. MPI-PUGE-AT-0058]
MHLKDSTDLPISFPFQFAAIDTISIPYSTTASSPMSNTASNDGSTRYQAITTVAQALEAARDTPEGAQDQTVVYILETALTEIWRKIEAQPASYVMTRDEFAVFNYFQGRFAGHQLAAAARRRYWDHLELTNGA